MDLTQEFAARITAAEPDVPGPELLPVRLARACAEVLPVAGAGLSVYFSADRRLPLGGSDPTAGIAERLQFTIGEGPCLTAHSTGQPVYADEEELSSRWPVFHDALVTRTPYRGIVSLPLYGGLEGIGALDLYMTPPGSVRDLGLADTLAITTALSATFASAMDEEPRSETGPSWLDAPAAGRRALVWQAVGFVGVGLELDATDALSVLRAHAYGSDRDLDEVARAVLEERLSMVELSEQAEAGP
ncbi:MULTISPECIES: GAF domain-containing protein [unclassified Modestobacter]|uniref:GAF domain-containing protein n=1 Tax=unclassified Modestobacter TaxID=2643866 RepID=UPI0022AA5590|nr:MULTISPECIES: GAF domain-containing protein [unclassified Modestobacter]MCZ2822874.1 GAF domain-containing protein [Modestobacter sp. VKM Ac-2981]MCZ2851120.1 GAF domain-containing protein [Modestobacter sp. VKM Ac-2982]